MLRKKMTVLLAMLLAVIALVSVTTKAYAAEETNLKLEKEALRSVKTVAGDSWHMNVELSVKEEYVVNPIFNAEASHRSDPHRGDRG